MIDAAILIHTCIVGSIVMIPAVSVAWGQRKASQLLIAMIDQQPAASPSLFRAFLFGAALNEAAAIIGSLMGIILVIGGSVSTWHHIIAEIGIGCAIILPAGWAGWLGAWPQCASISSIARQPLHAQKIMQLMFFMLTLLHMSVLLGLVIAFLIQARIAFVATWLEAIQLLSCGLVFGIGSLGPLYGMSCFTTSVCENVGRNPQAYTPLFSFSFISPALIETPVLFSLGIALFTLTVTPISIIAPLAAALAMGLATIGPGIASGRIAAAACNGIGGDPERASYFTGVSLFAQTIVDASAIYGLVIAVLILVFG